MRLKDFHILIYILIISHTVSAQTDSVPQNWGEWRNWGDRGDGTYANPIIPADYSDMDCIRVGGDYYAISSTFQYSPGVIVLHSKDLVNWSIVSHAVTDISTISPEMNWDKMNRYGRGVWAGAIRYHDKRFYIYFSDPDMGYFMTSAKKAEGPWEPLTCVLSVKGWDDCCPFWDDDGQGYLVGTNMDEGYKIHLFKMTDGGKKLIMESDQVIHQSNMSEANKFYKINGTYYHFFSEVMKGGRAVMMARSKNIFGPYTEIKQLAHPQKEHKEPNQGGIVQAKNGNWYFLTHHGTGDWGGRMMSLLPVNWVDGWPIIGSVGKDTIGSMVWEGKMPVTGKRKLNPITSDEFNKSVLGQQWEWNYEPQKDKWSLTERKGWVRLYAYKPIQENNLLKAGNTLTQRSIRTSSNEVVIKLDISRMTDGQKAGLSHLGSPNYSTLGVACEGVLKTLEYNVKGAITKGPAISSSILWLKSTWGIRGNSQYYYSVDGKTFLPFGNPYQLMWGAYRGDRIAIYSYNNKAETGYVDLDFFHYEYKK